jgi:UDP-2,3-diacylglucosamine pyrophosphatase LpxH
LTSFYMIQASVSSKDFLCHGHTHRENSSFIFKNREPCVLR